MATEGQRAEEVVRVVADGIAPARIVRSKRRTIALVVTADATLIVRAPFSAPLAAIEDIISKKSSWIRRTIVTVASRPPAPRKQFTDGEEFLYLGRNYPLSIVDDGAFSFDGGAFRLPRRCLPDARQAFTGWYREEAFRVIRERLDRYSAASALVYDRYTVTGARSRWGSCAGRGDVSFSWRLIMAPLEVIDYVVVHELVHIEQKDHSRRFWDKVGCILPLHEQNRRWLKTNGHLLTI